MSMRTLTEADLKVAELEQQLQLMTLDRDEWRATAEFNADELRDLKDTICKLPHSQVGMTAAKMLASGQLYAAAEKFRKFREENPEDGLPDVLAYPTQLEAAVLKMQASKQYSARSVHARLAAGAKIMREANEPCAPIGPRRNTVN